ncbi:MAG: GntR family transcriptional regulator [Chromatiales bacterium]
MSTPKYVLVENYIREAINNKQLVDKLPGERALAKELGYSYMTIRKAIENLVDEGVLYKVPTKGTYINNDRESRKKTQTIGYFLDSSIESGISSPYYSLIFKALEKEATRNDYSLMYFSDVGEDKLDKTVSKLDGVIATCLPRIENVIHELKQSLPLVVIDNSSIDKAIPSVIIDNFNAEVESVNYVCSLGHKRIGFMTGLEDSDIGRDRCAGYRSGLSNNGIQFDDTLVFHGNYSFESGFSGAEYFLSLKHPPTTIICANDSMALGVMRKLCLEGLKVPDDMSVIGFDDIEIAAQIIPPLTTIAAPVDRIAKHAFSMLMQSIRGEQLELRHVALDAHLVIRQTCGPSKTQ